MSIQCYIGLGSNLEDPLQQLRSAVTQLRSCTTINALQLSSLYQSKAVGPGDQDDYLNAVASFDTTLGAADLLALLHRIENEHGRTRSIRWGARTLDLDLLLYGRQCINTDSLTVPHPRLQERNFVLLPLAELAPELTLPNGNSVAALAEQAGSDGISVLHQHWL